MRMPESRPSGVLDAYGRPAEAHVRANTTCPDCQAGPECRVPSGGFGVVHEVCRVCGHEFETRAS